MSVGLHQCERRTIRSRRGHRDSRRVLSKVRCFPVSESIRNVFTPNTTKMLRRIATDQEYYTSLFHIDGGTFSCVSQANTANTDTFYTYLSDQSTLTTTVTVTGQGINADSIQVRYQSSDQAILAPASSVCTSTPFLVSPCSTDTSADHRIEKGTSSTTSATTTATSTSTSESSVPAPGSSQTSAQPTSSSTPSSTASSTPSSSPATSSSSGLSSGAKAGIGIGAVLGVLLILGLLWLAYRARKRKEKGPSPSSPQSQTGIVGHEAQALELKHSYYQPQPSELAQPISELPASGMRGGRSELPGS